MFYISENRLWPIQFYVRYFYKQKKGLASQRVPFDSYKNLIPNKFKIVMINESFVCLKLKMLERCYPREGPDAFSGSFFFGVAQRM